MYPKGKPPRFYAAHIVRYNPKKRKEAMVRIPESLRGFVQHYVDDYDEKKKFGIIK